MSFNDKLTLSFCSLEFPTYFAARKIRFCIEKTAFYSNRIQKNPDISPEAPHEQ